MSIEYVFSISRREEDDKEIKELKVLLDEAGEENLAKHCEIKGLHQIGIKLYVMMKVTLTNNKSQK